MAFINTRSFSRSVLKQWQHYFLTGEIEGKSEDLYSLLALHPVQTIESWQYVLDQHLLAKPDEWDGYNSDYDVNKTLFKDIQRAFLGLLSCYHFHPEDRAWIFRQIYGAVYEVQRLFPLRLPGEQNLRQIAFTPDEVFISFVVDLWGYFLGEKVETYTQYLGNYISSLIPFIPLSAYGLAEPDVTNDKVAHYTWHTLHFVFYYAALDEAQADDETLGRIQCAKVIKALFDNYNGELGQYHALAQQVAEHGLAGVK